MEHPIWSPKKVGEELEKMNKTYKADIKFEPSIADKLDEILTFLKDWKWEQDYRRNTGDNRPLEEIKK